MKKLVGIILALFLLVGSASALSLSDATLGGKDQERELYTTRDFTFTNDGASNLTSLALSSTAAAKYNVTFTGLPSTLAAGASATVTVQGFVPADLDGVDNDLEEASFKIGDLTLTADGGVALTSALRMQAENNLDIRSVHVEVDEDFESLDNGDKFTVKPGDEVSLTIKIRNRFSSNDDVDIDDVLVRVFTDSGDLDVDEEDELDVRSGDTEELTLTFDVEDDADADTHKLFITVEGVDDLGAKHGMKMEVDIKVDRESHELRLDSATLSTRKVKSCEGTNKFTLTAGVTNIGKRDENNAAVEVLADNLDIEQRKEDIELDQDDDARFKFSLEVPVGTPTGEYGLEVNTYYQGDTLSDSKLLVLEVVQCETLPAPAQPPVVQPQPQPPAAQPPAQQPAPQQPTGAATADPVKGRLQAFAESDTYLAMLAGLIAVVALAIILLIVAFARRR